MTKIMSVVGARPNFMKIAPFVHAIDAHNAGADRGHLEHLLLHTGQHHDDRMSASFFDALAIPRPDVDLGIGSGSHAEQVGRTMIAFEPVVREQQPDWIVVLGDVNATCACSITAKKEGVRLAHVEAGLRSFDLRMPEEINRMVTDRLSDLLFTTDEIAGENLRSEGAPGDRIKLVGNIMIDTLEAHRETAAAVDLSDVLRRNAPAGGATGHGALRDGSYAVLTLHRPSNVDDPATLRAITECVCGEVCSTMPLVWPIHPRARNRLQEFGLWEQVRGAENMVLLDPVGYHDMLRLNIGARIMLTDSGGLQEECCVLGTPCLTLRWNTERPVTLRDHGGVSVLVGNDPERIRNAFHALLAAEARPFRPPLWDGHTAERIVDALASA